MFYDCDISWTSLLFLIHKEPAAGFFLKCWLSKTEFKNLTGYFWYDIGNNW